MIMAITIITISMNIIIDITVINENNDAGEPGCGSQERRHLHQHLPAY